MNVHKLEGPAYILETLIIEAPRVTKITELPGNILIRNSQQIIIVNNSHVMGKFCNNEKAQ